MSNQGEYPTSDIPAEAPRITSYSRGQLDQMLAPIALYPDPLVAQILMAATYPLEVVEAARWLENPDNAGLHGDQLTAVLQGLSWDPSVKALVVFPDIVRMMNSHLQWAEQLGDAFLGQQFEVMDEIQHLRQLAQAEGSLKSTPYFSVVTQGDIIAIDSPNPDVLYVPLYNPMAVYGNWPYPDYPPDYYFPDALFGAALIDFRTGIYINRDLFFFHRFDFHQHRIDIDDRRFSFLNGGRPSVRFGMWTFDPAHRHGVPHHAMELRGSAGSLQGAVPPSQRPFRGFGVGGAGSLPPSSSTVGPAVQTHGRPSVGTQAQPPGAKSEMRRSRPVVPQAPQESVSPQPQRALANPPVIWLSPPHEPERGGARGRSFGGNAERSQAVPHTEMQRPSAPVFESHTHSFDARSQSERGQFSRSQMPPPQVNRSFGGERQNIGGGNRGGGESRPSESGRGHR